MTLPAEATGAAPGRGRVTAETGTNPNYPMNHYGGLSSL